MASSKPPQEDVSSEDSSSDDDDSLALDGVILPNPDESSSSSEEDDDDDDEKPRAGDKRKLAQKKNSNREKKKKSAKSSQPESIQVDFTFCDMNEKFFHGLKALLHEASTIYRAHASKLVDHMIDNISVGTVVSTEGDTEGSVFGFASVLNVTNYQTSPAIQFLKSELLKNCPADRKDELTVVLSGETKRPAGLLFHGRMLNMPLEIVQVLHQQLVLDMDWAVEHAHGGVDERKALDFGVFIRLAPCTKDSKNGNSLVYRFFDDEVFAGRADFTYVMEAPASYSKEEKGYICAMVITKPGHREAMKDMDKLIKG